MFRDDTGLIYRRRHEDKNQLLLTHSLILGVMKVNYDPVYAAHAEAIANLSLWSATL